MTSRLLEHRPQRIPFQLRCGRVPTLPRPLRFLTLQQRKRIAPIAGLGRRRSHRSHQLGVHREHRRRTLDRDRNRCGRRRGRTPPYRCCLKRIRAASSSSCVGNDQRPPRTRRTNSPHGFFVPIARACSAAATNRSRSRSLVVTSPRAIAWSYRSSSRPVSLRSAGTTFRKSGLPGDGGAGGIDSRTTEGSMSAFGRFLRTVESGKSQRVRRRRVSGFSDSRLGVSRKSQGVPIRGRLGGRGC